MCKSGGGILCRNGSNPTIVNVHFVDNYGRYGGGFYAYNAEPTVIDCTFWNNSVELQGGAILCTTASPMIIGCTIYGNTAPDQGGGLFAEEGSFPVLERTIIAGSLDGGSVLSLPGSAISLSCCNIYGNAGGDWVACIQDQYGFDGNIYADPLFCLPEAGDFTLQSGSSCLYSHHPGGWVCGLIGAHPIGCPASSVADGSVEAATWGGLKARINR
ncbi:MAG: right-handed parallel beta-helix repeat-containing protein [Candidatus Eisenbacteria bacterium]|uniref:Right-handed parallel beta-helix repeat-containing protein n=1 Tax=Eiseniibacteriota bacterium TaxID=2212470 RepID=A0A948RY29_UNCEI|nr:right-handed parallel beta-helix repeat-containing protein [Candidatus Eisenbacteria bacterium]MBU1949398.1 right-handed parallel beta-helix repeat-containing protein [Candidatus Eisenbacteria bacterium]MBU2691197.1 right-handed parallel beta-helix repeat-containing protein [Candidatus Eisenbacteria bacterium]